MLLIATAIIKPDIYHLEIYYFKNKESSIPDRYKWDFKMNECSIENYTNKLNKALSTFEQRCDKQFIFYTYSFSGKVEPKAINSNEKLMEYVREVLRDGANYLMLKAIEMNEEEQKQEQEEQKLTAAAEKIEQQFSSDKSNCVIQ